MIASEYLQCLIWWHCRECCRYAATCSYCLRMFEQFEHGPPNGSVWYANNNIRSHWTLNKCPKFYSPKSPVISEGGTHTISRCYYVGCTREHFLWDSPFKEALYSPTLHLEVHMIKCEHFYW